MMNRIKTTLAILGLLLALSVEAQVVLDKRTKQPIPRVRVSNYGDGCFFKDTTDIEGRIHIPLVGKETNFYGRNYKFKRLKTKQIQSDSIIYLKPEFDLNKTPSSAERTPRKRRGYTLMTCFYRVYEKSDSILVEYYDGFVDYLVPSRETEQITGVSLRQYGYFSSNKRYRWLVAPFMTTKTVINIANQKGWKYCLGQPASDLVRDGRFGGEVRIDSLAREVTMEYDCKLAGEPVFDASDDWVESRIMYFQSKDSLRLLQSFIRESYWFQDSLSDVHFDNLINRYKYDCFWFRNKGRSEDEKIEITQELYTISTKHISKSYKRFFEKHTLLAYLIHGLNSRNWARVYKFVPPMDSVSTSLIGDTQVGSFPSYRSVEQNSIFCFPQIKFPELP
jgi:hypothetical protein